MTLGYKLEKSKEIYTLIVHSLCFANLLILHTLSIMNSLAKTLIFCALFSVVYGVDFAWKDCGK